MVRTRWIGLLLVGAVLGVLWVVVVGPPALAACHAFSVSAQPTSVGEGATVKVTVSRDANLVPSNIDVETIDETARSGTDYTGVPRRTVSFSNETAQSFDVATLDDTEAEPTETFRLHLSNPGGCAVNPNYVVGPDATVTIIDNDETSTTTPSPPSPAAPTTTGKLTTGGGTTSTTAATSSNTDAASTATATLSSAPDTSALAAESARPGNKDGGSGGAWAIVAGLAIIVGAGAASVMIWQRRAHSRRT